MNLIADFGNLKNLGKNIQVEAANYKAEVDKIYAGVENLKNSWQGDDNQNYVRRVTEHKATIESLGKVIEDYGRFLETTASNLSTVQQRISEEAGKL